jgi:hypothetical protein
LLDDLKVYLLTSQTREETQKEFEILSVISHPNIVTASGLFLTATSDAIVMKL